jgi:hypothetical protein
MAREGGEGMYLLDVQIDKFFSGYSATEFTKCTFRIPVANMQMYKTTSRGIALPASLGNASWGSPVCADADGTCSSGAVGEYCCDVGKCGMKRDEFFVIL